MLTGFFTYFDMFNVCKKRPLGKRDTETLILTVNLF